MPRVGVLGHTTLAAGLDSLRYAERASDMSNIAPFVQGCLPPHRVTITGNENGTAHSSDRDTPVQ